MTISTNQRASQFKTTAIVLSKKENKQIEKCFKSCCFLNYTTNLTIIASFCRVLLAAYGIQNSIKLLSAVEMERLRFILTLRKVTSELASQWLSLVIPPFSLILMSCHCCLRRGAKLCVGKVKRKAVSKEMPLKDQIITRKFVKCLAFPRFIAYLKFLKRGNNLVPMVLSYPSPQGRREPWERGLRQGKGGWGWGGVGESGRKHQIRRVCCL